MKPDERQRQIAAIISQLGHQSVEALASRFAVSAETIRRDLAFLVETSAVQKVHGGARALRMHAEGSFEERMAEDATAKKMIGQKLAALIEPGETLFIDTGTTTLSCAEALKSVTGLTIITNSVRIAQAFGLSGDTKVILLGGRFAAGNGQSVGATTIAQIAEFRADRAILTPAAIDPEVGIMDSDLDEAQVARAMYTHARSTVVVAASSKFGRRAVHRVCRFQEVDILVTDQLATGALASLLHDAGVTVL
jgi:DeoR/GlpR family transcriptional regulator of sugar metabolism